MAQRPAVPEPIVGAEDGAGPTTENELQRPVEDRPDKKAEAKHAAGENPYTGLTREEFKAILKDLHNFWEENIKKPWKNGEDIDQEMDENFKEKQWLVRYALWGEGLDENTLYQDIEYEEAQARNEANRQQNTTTEVIDYENPPTYEEAVKKILEAKKQPNVPQLTPAEAAAAASLPAGLDQSEAAISPISKQKLTGQSDTVQNAPKSNKETSPDFAETLASNDKEIWNHIVELSELYKDAEVSERLEALQGGFDSEVAKDVVRRAEKSATKREKLGDTFGAAKQRELAQLVVTLNEHISGETISRAA